MSKKIFYILAILLLLMITTVSFFILKKQHISYDIKSSVSTKDICSSQKAIVDITYITDSQYVPPTMVSMYSAIVNKCPTSTYNFHIIAENITDLDAERIFKLKELSPDTINITIIPSYEPDLPFENMQIFLQK